MIVVSKACTLCGKSFHGRTDKKFCNDYCRNAYNNRLNSNSTNYMRYVDHRLRKNRRVLQSIAGLRQSVKTSVDALHDKGFLFAYCTHTRPNRRGKLYRFCYDYGFMILKNDQVMIVRNGGDSADTEI